MTDNLDLDTQEMDAPEMDAEAKAAAAANAAEYEHGWSSDIDTEFAEKGLNEDTVRFI
ncbi:MAG: Fe-S cluster assembly protein SufB, partial [Pseudomonadota bacterium]